MARRKNLTLNDLPLYATDEEIGEAVLGWARKGEFKGLAVLHERQGMPRMSPVWGGRYVPAVKLFLDGQNGVTKAVTALAPNGIEGSFDGLKRMRKPTPRV
ncbi:hypothetical protein [Nitrobacter vulgaris]|uniref:hypothetical protein n=1 Tax=Nitrobacter vulgaris TaxID=29421 RepID=UPI000B42311E|nr:hypothetical protein [Nitrobacter vulgaris]